MVNCLLAVSDEGRARLYRTLFKADLKNQQKEYRKKYEIDPSFKFNGVHIHLYGDGQIILGKDSYIGDFSTIQSSPDHKVVIGKKCSISHNVRVYTESNVADQDFSLGKLITKTGDVVIEDYAWIGANVFINPGVVIGRNSVVGANSVVVKDLPANGVYGGVPAKLLKTKTSNQ